MLDGIRAASQSVFGRALLALLMALIVVSFAVFGIGDIFRGFNAGKVAEVGTTEISAEAYRSAYQQELQRLQRTARRVITNDEARARGLDQQILSRLVAEAVLDGRAKTLGLAMSDADVARAIAEDPSFKDEAGRFDRLRFQEILRDNGFNEQSFVRQQRAVYLRQEIAEAVAGRIAAPRVLLAAIHRFGAQTRSVDHFTLPPSSVGEIAAPDDAALQRFFEERRSAFTAPEYRKIVALALTPALAARAEDVSDADATKLYDEVKDRRFASPERRRLQQIVFPNEAEAQAAAAKIQAGATFGSVLADRKLTAGDVDLGLVSKADVGDPALAEAAFATAQGGVSAPVKTRFGAALLHVVAIEPSQVKPYSEVASLLKNEIARDRAKRIVRELHDKVENARASGKPLGEAARAAGLEARTIEAVDGNGRDKSGAPVTGLTAGPELIKAAFASDIGVDNETITTPDDGYVWFEVAGIEPAHQRTLDEVRDRVAAAWREEEAQRRLAEKAAALVQEIQDGGDIAKVAQAQGAELKHDNGVRRGGGADLPPNAVVQMFNVPVGGAGSASTPAGRLVFRVIDEVVPDFDPETPEAKQAAAQMNAAYEQDLLSQYVQKLEAEAGVRVNNAALRAATGGGEP